MKRLIKILDQRAAWIAAALLLLFTILSIASVWNDAQSMDEAVHLSAGYSYLSTGDYRLNPEHPPLMKMLAAVPLFFANVSMPIDHPTWTEAEQWGFGSVFVYENSVDADTIMRLGRFPTIIISVLLGVLIFKWSKQLFGPKGALLSLVFLAFDATMLAHSHYVTTDAIAALGFFLTVVAYYQYLTSKQRLWFWMSAGGLVFALLSKYSGVILFPVLVLLWMIKRWQDIGSTNAHSVGSLVRFWLASFGVFLVFSWAIYGFQFTLPIEGRDSNMVLAQLEDIRASGDPSSSAPGLLPKLARVTDPSTLTGSVFMWWAENVPMPAWDYYRGMISVFLHNTYGHASYLLGNHANSFWNYFIVAFFVKTPSVTLIFIGLAGVVVLQRWVFVLWELKNDKDLRRVSWFVRWHAALQSIPFYFYAIWVPVIVYFLWSLTARINLGVRHLLPIYPFLFVFIGALATVRVANPSYKKIYAGCVAMLLGIYIVLSLTYFPYYLAYFNEFVGGPARGYHYLLDSNVEWGQDLKRLKTYLEEHGETDPVYLQYFGTARPDYYGIVYDQPPQFVQDPEPRLDRLMILSVDAILSSDGAYAWVLQHQPVDRVGYSFYIYDFRNQR